MSGLITTPSLKSNTNSGPNQFDFADTDDENK